MCVHIWHVDAHTHLHTVVVWLMLFRDAPYVRAHSCSAPAFYLCKRHLSGRIKAALIEGHSVTHITIFPICVRFFFQRTVLTFMLSLKWPVFFFQADKNKLKNSGKFVAHWSLADLHIGFHPGLFLHKPGGLPLGGGLVRRWCLFSVLILNTNADLNTMKPQTPSPNMWLQSCVHNRRRRRRCVPRPVFVPR